MIKKILLTFAVFLFIMSHAFSQSAENAFISVWNTDVAEFSIGVDESSIDNQIKLPLVKNGQYDFTVNWGDGTSDSITQYNDPAAIHIYDKAGVYEVTISGKLQGWQFGEWPIQHFNDILEHASKIVEIKNWGCFGFGDTAMQFACCQNLIITARDKPDLTGTASLAGCFYMCLSLEKVPEISEWDVSNITSMMSMFWKAYKFNDDLSGWDTSGITNMSKMFDSAESFNQDISGWDTSNVTDMSSMFYFARHFNQDISGWDTSNVTDMKDMFSRALDFNCDISKWDFSSVIKWGWFLSSSDFSMENYEFLLFKLASLDLPEYGMINVRTFHSEFTNNIIENLKNEKNWGILDLGNMDYGYIRDYDEEGSYQFPRGVTEDRNGVITMLAGCKFNAGIIYGFDDEWQDSIWESLDDSIAGVSRTGVIYAIDAGQTTVTMTNRKNGTERTWKIHVAKNDPFIIEVNIPDTDDSEDKEINIGTYEGLVDRIYNCTIDWGDGYQSFISSAEYYFENQTSHYYFQPGIYTVKIQGFFVGWENRLSTYLSDMDWLINIKQWGCFVFDEDTRFSGSRNLTITASDIPDYSNIKSFKRTFKDCFSLKFIPSLPEWDISGIENMNSIFNNVQLDNKFYDKLLISWAEQNVQDKVFFVAGESTYSSAAVKARKHLTDEHGWIIVDGGIFK